jgi:DNA replication protein DnaC
VSSPYNIKADALSTADAERLAERFPHLGVDVGPYDYCPTCKKTGSYRWRGEVHECDCFEQLQLHKHYLNSGIGVPYQRLGWDDWMGDPALVEVARLYLAKDYVDRGMGMFVWGDIGTGKTMLTTLVLKELVKRGKRCYAITAEELIDEFTKGWASNEDKRWYERKVKRCEVLLLDDLAKERNRGDLPKTTIDNLLRSRVQAGLPTLVTTNYEPKYLGIDYGSAALRLLHEQSLPVEMRGTDVSLAVNARNNQEMLDGEVRPIL